MSCEGAIYSMGGYPRIEFAVASEGLAQDVHHAFVRFGIVSKLWKKKDRCWRVEITEPTSVELYQQEIGWSGEKTRRFKRFAEPRRSNLGYVPNEIWQDIRIAAKTRGLTLSQLAVQAGETRAHTTAVKPPAPRQ